MKKYVKVVLTLAATVLTFVATTSVANACICLFYQPEVPAALKED